MSETRIDDKTIFSVAHLTSGEVVLGPLCLVRQVGDLAYAPMTYLCTADGQRTWPMTAVMYMERAPRAMSGR